MRIDVVEVNRSLRPLEVDSESVVRDPTTLETREKLGVIGSRVDIRSNSIVLIATRVTEEVSRWAASSYPGASVEAGEAPQPKEACDNLH